MFEVAQRKGVRRPRQKPNRRNGRRSNNNRSEMSHSPARHQPSMHVPTIKQNQLGSCSASSQCGIVSNPDQQQQLNPLVAKLLRGESLTPQRSPNSLDRIFNETKGPDHYREQIQICVANPGRFLASWNLLVTLFGEVRLYDYIHKCSWTEHELKQFVIKEELLEDEMMNGNNHHKRFAMDS